MVNFTFRVNPSFRDYPSHPITVPKSQVDYGRLLAEGFGPDVTIKCPDGGQLVGQLYRGTAGYGEYYQLRLVGHPGDCRLDHLPLGALLRVQIHRRGEATEVLLQSLHG